MVVREGLGGGWGWCARGPPGIVCSNHMNHYQGVPARVSYPATLDVPESIAHTICLWLAAHRRAHDARPWQRAATCRVPGGAGAAVDGGGHRPDHPGPRLEGEPGHGLQVPATGPWG